MADLTHQEGRQLQITTPLGDDALILTAFTGGGGLSGLFSYEAEMFSETQLSIAAEKIVGQPVDVSIARTKDDEPVIFNAHVRRFSAGGVDARDARIYRATLVPWLWFLTCRSNCRIFQEKSLPDIVETVLSEHSSDFKTKLKGTYPKREYCVQYNETDFAFVSRLLEEIGATYYFEHSPGCHEMVITDDPKSFAKCKMSSVDFRPDAPEITAITAWAHQYEYRPGRVTHRDFHFVSPAEPHEASEPTILTKVSDAKKHELFEYPAGFTWTSKTKGDPLDPAAKRTHVRMLGEESAYEVVQGSGTCVPFVAGATFTLEHHGVGDEEKKKYLLTHVQHSARDASYFAGSGAPFQYANQFRCIPVGVRFVPDRVTPRPRVDGIQTATVTGPSGEEIYVDKYGRVKVQFHWDREGKRDEKSSCWIRVAQGIAGKEWGAVYHPRIGQEVVVHFLEGDPDKPLVTGLVYNADLMPPFELPSKKNISGYKSHSTLDGTADHFNQLTFDDTMDNELVYFHAQHDFERVVENDDRLKVGFDKAAPGSQLLAVFNNQDVTIGCDGAADGSQIVKIFKDRTVYIETGDDTLTVDAGDRIVTISAGSRVTEIETDETISIMSGHRTLSVKSGNDALIVQGDRTVEVKQGDDSHLIGLGSRTVAIDTGDDTLKLSAGSRSTSIGLGKDETEAMQSIELKVGGNSILIDQMGVTIKGIMVKIEGQALMDMTGAVTKVSGSGMTMIKGGIVMIN